MLDDIRSDDGLNLDGQRRVRRLDGERPLTDREVPLGQQGERRISAAVQAWLDGELPEAAVRKGDTARDVEFWNRLNGEAERRRHMRTPTHLSARIMAAIPQSVPQVITPWYRREFVLTPRAALISGGAIVGITAAATAAILYLMR
jgi:hypothetical protein